MSDNQLKGQEVVGKALARAMFDAPANVVYALGRTVFQPGLKVDGEKLLARLVVDELAHAGWQLGSARDCKPEDSHIAKRLCLDNHVEFGIGLMSNAQKATLGSSDRAVAVSARAIATMKIIETFELMRVRLVKRARR